ncbi:methylated-DNA--[protein]-cysteine S-methyltransferase [Microbacterium gorillae]|uniref:methylated-DNA--[protein]-cysteine S-methyltransferase n=1 Tax=Microbacterium gorillae TaxID=1231063 RepID=UPI00058DE253|nr:methylated-DNA--[protein]-cysteine S-methyltransferase [Microbacterium gorillae]
MTAIVEFVDTPDGPFGILSDADGAVIASGWTAELDDLLGRLHPEDRPADVAAGATDAAAAVRAFYAGDVTRVASVPVHQRGTAMQHTGWDALRRIAPGAPLSYAEFAAEMGSPTAVRAAASVCARNAVALFVPCHRVLRGDGTMGGFAWGVEVKRSLLAREAA